MAITAKGAFAEALRKEMSAAARDCLYDDLVSLRIGAHGFMAIEEHRTWAREKVDSLTDEQVMQVLHDTMPEPCPTCGHA